MAKIKQADSWDVGACDDCDEGLTVLSFIDRDGEVFAQAHGFDTDALVSALLTGESEPCLACVIEKLEGLLARIKTARTSVSPQPEGKQTEQHKSMVHVLTCPDWGGRGVEGVFSDANRELAQTYAEICGDDVVLEAYQVDDPACIKSLNDQTNKVLDEMEADANRTPVTAE